MVICWFEEIDVGLFQFVGAMDILQVLLHTKNVAQITVSRSVVIVQLSLSIIKLRNPKFDYNSYVQFNRLIFTF
jgi:hypothetical protein